MAVHLAGRHDDGMMFDKALSNQQALITSAARYSRLPRNDWHRQSSPLEHSASCSNFHAVLRADLRPGWSETHRPDYSRSGFLDLLEYPFRSRADVQCGDGTHCLLRRVAGYVSPEDGDHHAGIHQVKSVINSSSHLVQFHVRRAMNTRIP